MPTVIVQKWYWETLDKRKKDPTVYTLHPSLEACSEFVKANTTRWDLWCNRHLENAKADENRRSLKKLLGKDIPDGSPFSLEVSQEVYDELTASSANTFSMYYLCCTQVEPKLVLSTNDF